MKRKMTKEEIDVIKNMANVLISIPSGYVRELIQHYELTASAVPSEENQYRIDLINELINIYEHPEDSNKEWKDAIISIAREKGYGV